MRPRLISAVAAAAILLAACSQDHLDGTNQQTFDHSIAVMLHGRDPVDQALFNAMLGTVYLKEGASKVRASMDAMTYSEALEYLKAHSR